MSRGRSALRALAAILALLVALPGAGRASGPEGAVAVVEALDAVYLEVMKNAQALGFAGRVAKLEPVLTKSFDFAAMARLSVGGRWRDLTPEQQQKLVSAFARMSIATYAGRFTGWDGEAFEIVGHEPSTQGTVLVQTRVVAPGKDPVQLNYRVRPGPDGWRILDVFLNGTVSELALRRSEYAAVLDRSGFDGLLAALDQKILDFATKPTAGSAR